MCCMWHSQNIEIEKYSYECTFNIVPFYKCTLYISNLKQVFIQFLYQNIKGTISLLHTSVPSETSPQASSFEAASYWETNVLDWQ